MKYRNEEGFRVTKQGHGGGSANRGDPGRRPERVVGTSGIIRVFLSLWLVLVLGLAVWGEARSPVPKKLIAWGGLDWYSPATVQMQIRRYETLPFDGMILQGFTAEKDGQKLSFDQYCFGREKFQREHLTQTINTLKTIDFQRYTDNFLRYNVSPGDVDWFEDFDAILHNARLWAAVTQEVGVKGWMFDVEDYRGTVFNYTKETYAKEKSFSEYAAQVRLRGREFMQAVQEGFPDIVIFLTHAHSFVYCRDMDNGRVPLAEVGYALLPAFLNGMIEAAGPGVKIIDGQEQAYGYLQSEEYYQSYHNAKQAALALVPAELHDKYRAKMDVGIAIYANAQLAAFHKPGMFVPHYMTAEDRLRLFEQNVYTALAVADEYVWLYSEHMDWCQPGAANPTPPGTFEAIRSAQAKLRAGQPLGFDITDTIAAARSQMETAMSGPWPALRVALSEVTPGQTPRIDGLLDDTLWANVPTLGPFVPYQASKTKTAQVATSAQAAFDNEHLYLAFRCVEPEPAKLVSYAKARDGDVWKGDCVEILLRVADQGPPFHLIIDYTNIQWDGFDTPEQWDAQWQSAVHVNTRQWTVEIAIPWSQIGVSTTPPATLHANLCRHRAASDEYTTWSPMFSSNLEPDHLGLWKLTK